MDLGNNQYMPFRQVIENINIDSNHPPHVLKNTVTEVAKRLSTLCSSKQIGNWPLLGKGSKKKSREKYGLLPNPGGGGHSGKLLASMWKWPNCSKCVHINAVCE